MSLGQVGSEGMLIADIVAYAGCGIPGPWRLI